MTCWRRRDVLGAIGVGLAGAACGTRSPPPCVVPRDGGVSGGSYCLVESEGLKVPGGALVATGQALLFNVDDNTAVVLVRDAGGLYAMSGICTHQCCLLSLCQNAACTALGTNPGECNSTDVGIPAATGDALVCACHGSTFAIDGAVNTGPATKPLPHYGLSVAGDDVYVDTGNVVDPTTRV